MNRLIVTKKTVLAGRPHIVGTRVSVDHIATYVSSGLGVIQIHDAYPNLSKVQIEAALTYLYEQTGRQIEKLETAKI